ncbi:MAG: hypothetical protein ACRDKW_16030 [Actinomycetota bacterium]
MIYLVAHRDGLETVPAARYQTEGDLIVFVNETGDRVRSIPADRIRLIANIQKVKVLRAPGINPN